MQVGTPRALDDLATLTRILANRDVLNDLARRLPSHLRSFERDEIDAVKARSEGATTQKAPAGALAVKTDVFLYGFVLIMGRLAAPGSSFALLPGRRRATSPRASPKRLMRPQSTIVIGEVECMVSDLRTSSKRAGR